MSQIRFLPTKVHGVLDYVVGIALIAAPWIFKFAPMGGPAVFIPIVLGITLIVYSLLTRYEWGVLKVLPMPYHLAVDFAASAFLAAAPFIFGFIREAPNVWLPHVLVGLTVILVVIVSETRPRTAMHSRVSSAA